METMQKDLQIAEKNISSRRAAILMGGAALAGLAFARKAEAEDIDTFILQLALNLEYLEAQFYTLATQGKTIDLVGVPTTINGVTGGAVTVKPTGTASCLVPFVTPLLQQFAMEVAQDERNHVLFLQSALGTSAVAQPAIDLYNSFNALAVAAGVVPAGGTFDPFASETNFLLGAFIFEDVGVTAYLGAAGLITSSTYLDKAAGILAVEAYHAGSIRSRIFGAGTAVQSASQLIATERAKLDGTTTDDVGVGLTSNGAATIVDANSNSIAFSRMTGQVLSIVYAGGSTSGGFFPSGVTGGINTAT
jgi:hypothetical protein